MNRFSVEEGRSNHNQLWKNTFYLELLFMLLERIFNYLLQYF